MLTAFDESQRKTKSARTLQSYAISIGLYGALAATVLASTGRAVMRIQEEERTVLVRAPEPTPTPTPPPPPENSAPSAPRRLGRAATAVPTEIPNSTPTPSAPVSAQAPAANDLPVGDPFGTEGGSDSGHGSGSAQVAPTVENHGPIRLPESAERPVALSQVEPNFPDALRGSGVESIRITARITLDASGNVTHVDILRGYPELDNAILVRAISAWTFRAARVNGEAIAVHFIQPITFRLTI